MSKKKARIVTRDDLQRHYPGVKLARYFWQETEDDPDVGWTVEHPFEPSHVVDFYAYGAGRTATLKDYVYLDAVPNLSGYQEAFTPCDFTRGIPLGGDRMLYFPSYLKDPKTGNWWHTRNEHFSWVRGKCRVAPVTYMKELPSELREPEEQQGFVYFVSAGEGGPIKIGWSQDVASRIEQLQVGNAYKLILLAKIPGTMADEAETHKRFKHLRMESEWFRNSIEITGWLECLGKR